MAQSPKTNELHIEGLKPRFGTVCAALEEELRSSVGSPRSCVHGVSPYHAASDQEILPDDEGGGTPTTTVGAFHWWSDPLHRLCIPSQHAEPSAELNSLADAVEEIVSQNAMVDAAADTPTQRVRRPDIALKINTKAILGVVTGTETPRSGRDSRRNIDKVPSNPSVLDRILMILHRKPIIVVPSGPSKDAFGGTDKKMYSVLHVDNAVEFLDKGRLSMEQRGLKEDFSSARRQMICRKIGYKHHTVKFSVIDASTTHRFEEADWESVVCVFANGMDWQFKSWPLRSSEEVSQRMCTFYCGLKDRPLPRITQTGNCHLLLFPQMLRHTDGELQRFFWETLTEHLMRPAADLPALTLG